MNTPTEAHLDLALQIAEAIARSGNVAAAQLIADSEAEALSVVCGRHNALIAERDQLRAEVKRMTHAYEYDHKCLYEVRDRCHLWKQRAEKAEAQLHALRLVCGTTDANKFETWTDRANARAEKAEGQLKELVAYASALEDQLDSVGVQIARTAMKEAAK